MPPKVKVAKDMILDKAFAMTRENGFESVTARGLADGLGCSTQPIFRVYENMEMLKQDLCKMTQAFFADYMYRKQAAKGNRKKKQEPAFLAMGLSYVELARQESHLFRLLCSFNESVGSSIHDFVEQQPDYRIFKEMPELEAMTEKKKKELLLLVWVFTHGIASTVVNKTVVLSDKELRELLIKAYQAFENAEGKGG